MMNSDNHDILIIPDVHGRTFWKSAVESEAFGTIVFLGDYVDPYPSEGIDNPAALDNFREIIAYAECHDNVVLLLGNHDMHYYSKQFASLAMSSRYCYVDDFLIIEQFSNYSWLFSLAWETTLNGHHYLLTHSGVCGAWLKANRETIGTPDAEHLNRLLDSDDGIRALANVSRRRGGFHAGGSIVWGDINELQADNGLPDVYQIFGHTQQRESPVITDQMACLDVRRAFVLREGQVGVAPQELNPQQ